MARVHHVKKARKDYPSAGIKKGDEYWWWKPMVGGRGGAVRRMTRRPKPSETTQSDYYRAVYALQEDGVNWNEPDDIEPGVQELVGKIEEIRDETQEKYDNLPENFKNGQLGEQLQSRIDSLENAISELEQIETSFDEPIVDKDEDESDSEYVDRREQEIEEAKETWVHDRTQEAESAIGDIGD